MNKKEKLKVNDRILEANGQPIKSFEDLRILLQSYQGSDINFKVQRDEQTIYLNVPLSTRKNAEGNEEKYIGKCLDSILKNDYPLDLLDVMIVDGMSTDKTCSIASGYKDHFKSIQIIENIENQQKKTVTKNTAEKNFESV